jgi:hypothetical protein
MTSFDPFFYQVQSYVEGIQEHKLQDRQPNGSAENYPQGIRQDTHR